MRYVRILKLNNRSALGQRLGGSNHGGLCATFNDVNVGLLRVYFGPSLFGVTAVSDEKQVVCMND
jgi:hypothetical protein